MQNRISAIAATMIETAKAIGYAACNIQGDKSDVLKTAELRAEERIYGDRKRIVWVLNGKQISKADALSYLSISFELKGRNPTHCIQDEIAQPSIETREAAPQCEIKKANRSLALMRKNLTRFIKGEVETLIIIDPNSDWVVLTRSRKETPRSRTKIRNVLKSLNVRMLDKTGFFNLYKPLYTRNICFSVKTVKTSGSYSWSI